MQRINIKILAHFTKIVPLVVEIGVSKKFNQLSIVIIVIIVLKQWMYLLHFQVILKLKY